MENLKMVLAFTRAKARDDEGVTAVEYGLIAALVAVVMAVGATTLGSDLSAKFTAIAGQL